MTAISRFRNGLAAIGVAIVAVSALVSLRPAVGRLEAQASGRLLVASRVLSNAQILALPTTPITVVSAPGAGKRIVLVEADLVGSFSAGAYADVDPDLAVIALNLSPQEFRLSSAIANDSSTTPPIAYLDDFLGTASIMHAVIAPFSYAVLEGDWGNLSRPEAMTTASTNVALQILAENNGAGDFTGGNAANTLTVTVLYAVIP